MIFRKYKYRITHDPRREQFKAFKVEAVDKNTGEILATSSWTYSVYSGKRDVKDTISVLKAQKENKPPKVWCE